MQQLKLLFQEKLAIKPYCSDRKGAHLIRSKEHAIKKKYIQPNPPHMCSWLVFDCDHANQHLFREQNLPAPNWITVTPGTGNFHMAYAINDVFTTKKARKKPLAFLAAIQKEYTHLLDADTGYGGLITKNPLHDYWNTWFIHSDVYELHELADYVDLSVKREVQKSFGFGRNVDLFDQSRRWAYNNIHKFDCSQVFDQELLALVDKLNSNFDTPLPYNEVKSVAKSISRYTWANRDYYVSRHARKIGLNPQLPLETKQSLGAAYTATVKAESSQAKIRAAKEMLTSKGEKATQKAIAAATGLGIATVKRHWKEV